MLDNHLMKEKHSKETKTTKLARMKENASSVETQTILLENVRNCKEVKTTRPL
jgi:hypothetical protein